MKSREHMIPIHMPHKMLRPAGVRLVVVLALAFGSGACTLVGYSEPAPAPSPRVAPPAGDDEAVPDDFDAVPDAVPRAESKSRYGNPERYEVFGKWYSVMETSEGYEEVGIASWYGEPFHGRRTSSGETYDMYRMTAAHKALPLPTYVEVTNLSNGRSVVVKVNDRGPFHEDRIIDLSYVAAYKLGMLRAGTTRVRVRALEPAATDPGG